MMKPLLFVVVILSLSSLHTLFAEDHQNGQGSGPTRQTETKAQSRIFEYVSACLAGRPISGSSSGVDLNSISLTPPGGSSGSTPIASPGGEAVFRGKCLTCHSGSSGPPNLTVLNGSSAGKAIAQVQSGNMPDPKSGITLSAQEKADLIKFLESKR